jgi:hypothetical protein
MSRFFKNIILFLKQVKGRFFCNPWFRYARKWSNRELKKFSHLFGGDILNASGWRDWDKEGSVYRDYFPNLKSYTISNYPGEAGFQGDMENEFLMDLEKDLPSGYEGKFDVVFNHTTLEHIFEIRRAFSNLCLLSKDIVIIVAPFLQPLHANESFKDYWRLTPYSVKRMFEENNFSLLYLSLDSKRKNHGVYIFAIGSRHPERWKGKREFNGGDFLN